MYTQPMACSGVHLGTDSVPQEHKIWPTGGGGRMHIVIIVIINIISIIIMAHNVLASIGEQWCNQNEVPN